MRLGNATVHVSRNEIVLDGEVRRVKPKAMSVLDHLMDAPGAVVPRETLLDSVWPRASVSENVLTEAIHELRVALEDEARSPRYIKTIPRRGYCLLATPAAVERTSGAPERLVLPRIGVSNFECIGPDREDRYFCEGLCEELTSRLGEHPGIEVLARTTTLRLGKGEDDPRTLAREMGVTHLIEGSFRREGDQARIVAKLVDVKERTQLWSDAYQEAVGNLLELQVRIAAEVTRNVAPQVTAGDPGSWTTRPEPVPEAFLEFSKGRYFWKRDNLNPQRALTHYESARGLDPDFAGPLAGIVECLNTLAVFHVVPQGSVREEAIRLAERALFLSPEDPEALFAFGYMQFYMHWDWRAAEEALERCLSINPNHPLAHGFLGLLNAALRREEKSRHHVLTQTRLDPFSTVAWLHQALHFRYFRNDEASLQAAREGLELRSNDVVLRWVALDSLLRLGHGEGLREEIRQQETATVEDYPMFQALTGLQHLSLGCDEGYQRIERRLAARFREQWPDPFTASLLAVGRGDAEAAIDHLEAAFDVHDAGLWLINCDTSFESLEGHPRLTRLRERMGLPTRL